jgi:SAM-dependent methyltransferase
MSQRDRERWEAKYEKPQSLGAPQPSLAWIARVTGNARALDIACGRGRHSLALTDLGYRVVAVDIARGALQRLAATGPPAIVPVQADLDDWPFAPACFDLIVQVDFLDRSLFAPMRKSLRPGGLLLIDTFKQTAPAPDRFGPGNPAFRLEPGELERTFGDWEILKQSEQNADAEHASRAAILVRRSA